MHGAHTVSRHKKVRLHERTEALLQQERELLPRSHSGDLEHDPRAPTHYSASHWRAVAKVAGLEVDIGVDERNGGEEPWECHQNQTVEGFQGGQQRGSDR